VAVLGAVAQGAEAFSDPTGLRIALALREGDPLCICDLGFIVSRDEKLVFPSPPDAEGSRAGRLPP